MTREPTASDVRAAWHNYRGSHNFQERPHLYLPLTPPLGVHDVVVDYDAVAAPPVSGRYCVISLERDYVGGERVVRIVGSVPGTDISVVLLMGRSP